MRPVAVIQARMRSTRLPGKVLMPLAGKPVIQHVVERVAAAGCFDDIVIATGHDPANDPIVEWWQKHERNRLYHGEGVEVKIYNYFMGDENDVLGRYAACAWWLAGMGRKPDLVCRITADCPLIDPPTIRKVVDAARRAHGWADLTTNVWRRSYPKGWDTEVLTLDALLRLDRMATELKHREHVTFALYPGSQPNYVNDAGWRVRMVEQEQDDSAINYCLDTPEDYERLRAIVENPSTENTGFAAEQEAALTELTRITEELGLYEDERKGGEE